MKRTYPANIDGQLFYIDEDAFNLLRSYLDQLHITFKGAEGAEIVGDIESRIRELLICRPCGPDSIVTLSDINYVIQTLGRPEEISDDCTGAESPCEEPHSEQPFISFNLPGHKRLYRNLDNKVFGGVIGGLATYLNWNANIMRLFYLVLALCTYFWPLTIIYLIAWMVIPAATTPKQILEMKGEAININTVGQAVMESSPTPPPYKEDNDNFFSTLFSVIGKCIMGFFGLVAGSIALACLAGFIAVAIGGVASWFYHDLTILNGLHLTDFPHLAATVWFCLCMLLLGSVVGGGVAWGAFSVIFHLKGLGKIAVGTIIVAAFIMIIAAIVLHFYLY